MENNFKLTAMRIALIGSIMGGIAGFNGAYSTHNEIRQNPHYNIAKGLDNINKKLNSASKDIEYHTADYPNPADARVKIAEVLPQIRFDGFLERKLREVYNSLPEQNDVKLYRGKAADNSTFENQRGGIERVSEEICFARDWNTDQVRGLRIKERNYLIGLVLSALSGAWALSYVIPRKEAQ